MEFRKYPSIEQFRNIVKQVKQSAQYLGYDEEAQTPIMDRNAAMPVLTFTGTVKLHGTNAGVSLDKTTGEVYAQSRRNLITPEKDNAGFAFFVENNKDVLKTILLIHSENRPDADVATIYGEWCGGNIQKNVGICGLEKMFVIFGCKVGEEWIPLKSQMLCVPNIYFIDEFPTYNMDIDFSEPERAVNKLSELTLAVEAECPVAKALGDGGIGEGIVWTSSYKDQHLMFKVKGEKHSASKVKTLAKVDTEKMNSIAEFVEYAVTENRLEQGIEQVFTISGDDVDITRMGDFLRWVMSDIIKEESDTLVDNKLEPKDIGRAVSNKARTWFINRLKEF